MRPQDLSADFTLKNFLFGAVKLTTNPIQTNILILDMVFDLTLVHFFHIQILIEVKMLLFLE